MGLLILAFGNSFSESVKLQKLVFGKCTFGRKNKKGRYIGKKREL